MKLYELFEDSTPITPKKTKGKYRSLRDIHNVGKRERLGHGIEAVVFKANTPNTVIKEITTRNPPEEHAYSQFLKVVEQHKDNPFFPRIYSAKWYESDSDFFEEHPYTKMTLVVKMEQLYPVHHPKFIHNIPTLLKQIGVPDRFFDLYPENPQSYQELEDHQEKFKDAMRDPQFIESMMYRSKNPQFVEAMTAMKPLFDRFISDLHFGNFMVRLTGKGPQLVITDPFYYAKQR